MIFPYTAMVSHQRTAKPDPILWLQLAWTRPRDAQSPRTGAEVACKKHPWWRKLTWQQVNPSIPKLHKPNQKRLPVEVFFICLPLIGLCQVEPVSTSTILTNMAELSATIAVIGLLQRLKQRRSCETSPKVTELWPSMKHIVQNWYIGHALVLFKASTRPICRHSSLVKIHLSHPGNI